jgi:RNA polymerase sigma factor (sigma-70 family)
MENPFHLHYPDQVDSELIQLAVQGDKRALQTIIQRHQIFVYNLAMKMSRNRNDAHDLTQEVFIKAITSLGKFEGKSSFRTWLYRITVNHFLNCKKRKTEIFINDFEGYFSSIDRMPDYELNGAEEADLKDSIEELRISCTAGMLMCLDRDQRLTYILGEMFKVDHNLGAEILGTTPGNFRVRLSRARSDLYSWMNKRCSLVNAVNPCKCAKKTRAYIASGAVNPDSLQFNIGYTKQMHELAEHQAIPFENTIEDLNAKVFLSHPLHIPKAILIDEIFSNDLLKEMLKR